MKSIAGTRPEPAGGLPPATCGKGCTECPHDRYQYVRGRGMWASVSLCPASCPAAAVNHPHREFSQSKFAASPPGMAPKEAGADQALCRRTAADAQRRIGHRKRRFKSAPRTRRCWVARFNRAMTNLVFRMIRWRSPPLCRGAANNRRGAESMGATPIRLVA